MAAQPPVVASTINAASNGPGGRIVEGAFCGSSAVHSHGHQDNA
jgi:hypothetical protein